MRKSLLVAGLAALVAPLAMIVPGHAAPPVVGSGQTTCMMNNSAGMDGGTVTWSPAVLWPPNHNPQTVTIKYFETSGSAEPMAESGETLSIANVVNTNSDTVNGVEKVGSGSPNNNPDATVVSNTNGTDTGDASGAAVLVESIRAERSGTDGNGSGRLYTITFQCQDTEAGMMEPGGGGMATVTVCVPHDMSEASRQFCAANIPQS